MQQLPAFLEETSPCYSNASSCPRSVRFDLAALDTLDEESAVALESEILVFEDSHDSLFTDH